MTMSDRIAVMNRGRYEQLGDPETLYERPATRFVAGFLGRQQPPARRASSRRRPTRPRCGSRATTVVRVPAAAVGEPPRPSTSASGPRRSGCTSEGTEPPAGGHNVLAGTVRDASYLGVSTQYVVETRSGAASSVYEQNVERTIHGPSCWARGEDVRLTWSPDHTFVGRGRPERRAGRRGTEHAAAVERGPGGGHGRARLDPRADRITRRRLLQGERPRRRRRLPRRLRHDRHRRHRRASHGRRIGGARERQPPRRVDAAQTLRRGQLGELAVYIDDDEDDRRQARPSRSSPPKYGTTVNYQEVINDNDDVLRHDPAAAPGGQDTGWDIVVLTDWMAARLIRLGWVETIDLANMPNFVANLKDVYKGVDWDPDTNLHAPWQSGMTGLGFDEAVTGEPDQPRRALDRRRPLEGPGRLPDRDARHRRPHAPQARLRTRATSRSSRLDEAFAEIQTAVDDGIVRSFTGNDYAEDLGQGQRRPRRWPGPAT